VSPICTAIPTTANTIRTIRANPRPGTQRLHDQVRSRKRREDDEGEAEHCQGQDGGDHPHNHEDHQVGAPGMGQLKAQELEGEPSPGEEPGQRHGKLLKEDRQHDPHDTRIASTHLIDGANVE